MQANTACIRTLAVEARMMHSSAVIYVWKMMHTGIAWSQHYTKYTTATTHMHASTLGMQGK